MARGGRVYAGPWRQQLLIPRPHLLLLPRRHLLLIPRRHLLLLRGLLGSLLRCSGNLSLLASSAPPLSGWLLSRAATAQEARPMLMPWFALLIFNPILRGGGWQTVGEEGRRSTWTVLGSFLTPSFLTFLLLYAAMQQRRDMKGEVVVQP